MPDDPMDIEVPDNLMNIELEVETGGGAEPLQRIVLPLSKLI